MKKRILIIENQYIQFDTMQRELSSRYEVLPAPRPTPEENVAVFKAFIDPVRIALNPRYKRGQRDRAYEEFKAYLIEKKPDLLIIDYILVSHSAAQTGIDLAKRLRNDFISNKVIPILFVSRTPRSKVDILKGLESMKLKEWVDKQYYAGTLLDPTYVTDVVMRRIEDLFNEAKDEDVKLAHIGLKLHLVELLKQEKFMMAMAAQGIKHEELLIRINLLDAIPAEAAERIEHNYIHDDLANINEEQAFIRFVNELTNPKK